MEPGSLTAREYADLTAPVRACLPTQPDGGTPYPAHLPSNSGTSVANNWRSTWTVPSGVTLSNGWNATVTQSGTTFTAAAPSWTPSLAAGASVTVGFTATGPSTPAANAFTLNGTACT
jgi:hypothetical protein